MKKLIILSYLVLISFITLAQTPPYRPYAEFKGDIGAYLKYNFDDRGNLYQGKTISELLKDVELTPIGYSPLLAKAKADNKTYLLKLYIVFKRKTEGQFSEIHDEYLSVYIEEPWFLWSELKPYYDIYRGNKWTQQDYEVIKDKKIRIVKYQHF